MRHQAKCSVTPGSVKLGAMGKPCRQGLLRCFGQVYQRPETLKSTLMWEPPDSTQPAECCYVSEVSLNCSALTAARLTGPTPQASREASRLRWSLDNARLYDVVWYGMLHRTLATLASCYTRVWTCPTACAQVHMCVCVCLFFFIRGPVTTYYFVWLFAVGVVYWMLSVHEGCRGCFSASSCDKATMFSDESAANSNPFSPTSQTRSPPIQLAFATESYMVCWLWAFTLSVSVCSSFELGAQHPTPEWHLRE